MKNKLLACMAGCMGMGAFSVATMLGGEGSAVYIPLFAVCVGLAMSNAIMLIQEYDKDDSK